MRCESIWWFGTRWMTNLINNIVKEGCIPDDLRKSIMVSMYKGKGSYKDSRLLEQPIKVLERVLENRIRYQLQLKSEMDG